ncbi:MAG: RCC1 domain-containing protein [Desulfomonilaceae bacterium]
MAVTGLYVCGANNYGQLGDGTTTNRSVVVPIQLPAYPVDVAGGGLFTVVLLEDGTVWSWGYNSTGQLGDGTTVAKNSPVQVVGVGGSGYLSGVVSIAAGPVGAPLYYASGHVLAVLGDGTVVSWGANRYGQLGDGTTVNKAYPVRVVGLPPVVMVACAGGEGSYNGYGAGTSYALTQDGFVYAWGFNEQGQLGDGTTISKSVPNKIPSLSKVVSIAGGAACIYPGSTILGGHALALKSDGTVWAWGYNGAGQLGDGTTTYRATPVQVSGLNDVIAIAAGGGIADGLTFPGHSLALKSDGTVWAWGYNGYGQLGDGTTTNRLTPVQVSGLTNVVAIAAGGLHSLAKKSDGTVWAWGYNGYGQLGDGTTTNRLTPVQVSGITGNSLIWKMAANPGGYHTVLMTPRPGYIYLGRPDMGLRKEFFVGKVLAGETLTPARVPVFNFTLGTVSGLLATKLDLPAADVIEISSTDNPFTPEDPVYLNGTFAPGAKIGDVWVRASPPILVNGQPNQGLKQFTLKVTNATT